MINAFKDITLTWLCAWTNRKGWIKYQLKLKFDMTTHLVWRIEWANLFADILRIALLSVTFTVPCWATTNGRGRAKNHILVIEVRQHTWSEGFKMMFYSAEIMFGFSLDLWQMERDWKVYISAFGSITIHLVWRIQVLRQSCFAHFFV